jgi:hypothetical protein
LHGRVLPEKITHWNNSRTKIFRCLGEEIGDAWAHLAGTGVLGFHSDTLDISVEDFPHTNYDDYEFSILTQRKNIPILIASHEEGYLKYLNVPTQDTIFYKTMYEEEHCRELTVIAQSIQWKLLSLS